MSILASVMGSIIAKPFYTNSIKVFMFADGHTSCGFGVWMAILMATSTRSYDALIPDIALFQQNLMGKIGVEICLRYNKNNHNISLIV